MNREENTTLNEMSDPNKIRLKVLTKEVNLSKTGGKSYSRLMYRYVFDDHRRFLKIGNRVIGFIVSPYNLHPQRHKALEMENHTVVELRQYYNLNAETIAVIQNDYLTKAIVWKTFTLENETK